MRSPQTVSGASGGSATLDICIDDDVLWAAVGATGAKPAVEGMLAAPMAAARAMNLAMVVR